MSNSPLVSYTKLSPFYSTVQNKQNKKITIHHMAGNLSVETCGNVFQSREASSNYGIGSDGRIGMYVQEHNRAWTSSSRSNDIQAVTIEVANDGGAPNWHVGDKALAALIDLCVDICKRNGIEKLVYTGDSTGNLTRHDMFTNTTCPGPYLGSKFPWIAEQVNKRLNGEQPTTTAPATSTTLRRGSSGPKVKLLQERLIYIGYNCGGYGADSSFGGGTESSIKEFQGNAGLPVNGVCDTKLYTLIGEVYNFAKAYPQEKFVREVQEAIGAIVDGTAGPETLSKTVTISMTKNNRHPVVKAVQKKLYALGYTIVGEADGKFGPNTDKAVREYQRDCGNYVDGEITSTRITWKKLLELA